MSSRSCRQVQFDRPFHLVSRAPRDLYSIYALDQPLAPGEVLTLTFRVSHTDPRLSRRERAGPNSPTTALSSTPSTFRRSATTQLRDRRPAPAPRRTSRAPRRDGCARRSRPLPHQSVHAAFRLDHLSHRRQHVRRSDRHRARISPAPMGAERPPLFTSTAWGRRTSSISSPISPPATPRARRSTQGPTAR